MTETKKQADIRAIKRRAALQREKAKLELRLTTIKADIAEADERCLSYFNAHGLANMKVGKQTIFLRRELWASKKPEISKEQAAAVLAAHGLEDYFSPTIDIKALSRYVRELEADEKELPEDVAAVINVAEIFKIAVRTAS